MKSQEKNPAKQIRDCIERKKPTKSHNFPGIWDAILDLIDSSRDCTIDAIVTVNIPPFPNNTDDKIKDIVEQVRNICINLLNGHGRVTCQLKSRESLEIRFVVED